MKRGARNNVRKRLHLNQQLTIECCCSYRSICFTVLQESCLPPAMAWLIYGRYIYIHWNVFGGSVITCDQLIMFEHVYICACYVEVSRTNTWVILEQGIDYLTKYLVWLEWLGNCFMTERQTFYHNPYYLKKLKHLWLDLYWYWMHTRAFCITCTCVLSGKKAFSHGFPIAAVVWRMEKRTNWLDAFVVLVPGASFPDRTTNFFSTLDILFKKSCKSSITPGDGLKRPVGVYLLSSFCYAYFICSFWDGHDYGFSFIRKLAKINDIVFK